MQGGLVCCLRALLSAVVVFEKSEMVLNHFVFILVNPHVCKTLRETVALVLGLRIVEFVAANKSLGLAGD